MNFGKSKAKLYTKSDKTVTFNNVAGADEEKEELAEIVDFLKYPDRYMKLGARIPKGVLLVGLPAQGKRCWPVRLQEKQASRFSPSAALISWKCLLGSVHPASEIYSKMRKRAHRALSLSTKSMQLDVTEVPDLAAVMMKESKR